MIAIPGASIRPGRWALCGLLALLCASCATRPKIDWAARIGNYSYDQAVMDYGPPDKKERLGDGTNVAEWLTRRGYAYTSAPAIGYGYPWYYGPFYPAYTESYAPNYYLRLVFGPDGKLKAWKKFAK